LLAHDPESDLALLKIATRQPMQTIPLGTSSDLMLAETVAAVGNAYGYDNTVTVGIISHLNRTVQVNENQIYRNLIQTDAPINPGNSGGPLINLDGEVIGINVAMRVGAQGIAFAIPINDAVEIASRLLAQTTGDRLLLGMSVTTQYDNDVPHVVVLQAGGSAPEGSDLVPGDRITAVDGQPVSRSLDFYCALLDKRPGDTLQLSLAKQGPVSLASSRTVTLQLEAATDSSTQIAWRPLGLELVVASESEMSGRHPNYNRGLKVVRVRPSSPAEEEGIQPGDVLVAMHGYKTESFENLAYILRQPDLQQKRTFVFYILRDKDPLFGQLRLAEAK
jgi:serine protease Do